MERYPCPSCGREIDPAPRCPYCNAAQGRWADEVARIEREIAEIKRRDIEIAREQRLLAQRMQAAQFQRDILAAANQERLKEQIKKTRKALRRRGFRRPPTADPRGPRIPHQTAAEMGPPPLIEDIEDVEDERPPAEASSREIQNVYLGLGALLLGVAAVVFAGVTPDAISRLAILTGAAGLMLGAAPFVGARGLSSTAETIAAVGLMLVPITGYALYTVDAIEHSALPGPIFAGIIFAITAAIAGAYAGATGLSVPRYATVLALQPVLPLLAYGAIDGPSGWGLALALVAALDIWLARQFAAFGALVPPTWSGRTATVLGPDDDPGDAPRGDPRGGPGGDPRGGPSGDPRGGPGSDPRGGPGGDPRGGPSAGRVPDAGGAAGGDRPEPGVGAGVRSGGEPDTEAGRSSDRSGTE